VLIHRQTFHGLWPRPPLISTGMVRLPRSNLYSE
jgi:hypothetical protein